MCRGDDHDAEVQEASFDKRFPQSEGDPDMIRSLWTAASGMQAQTTNIDVISNNLSNVNTAGFKRSRAEFQDLLYETMRPPGVNSAGGNQVPTGIQVGHGTRTAATHKLFTQGDFQHTQNELDMAIEGQGFFQIVQPQRGDRLLTGRQFQNRQRGPNRNC